MHILVVYGSIVYGLLLAMLPACALVVCLSDQTVDIIACSKKSGKNWDIVGLLRGKTDYPDYQNFSFLLVIIFTG